MRRMPESLNLPYVPLTFPTVTVRNNMDATGVKATSAEVDRLWAIYKTATVEKGIKPFNPTGHDNLPIIQALETGSDYTRIKVVAWLNGLYKAVSEQGFGWMWLDPAGAAASDPVGSVLVDPIASIKRLAGDSGQALANFVAPVADPLTNALKWAAVLVVGGAAIYGLYEGTKFFKGRKGRKG